MDWRPVTTISSSTSHEQYYEFRRRSHGDGAAEAAYNLVGYPNPASFTVQAREDKDRRIEVQYHNTLSSPNNPENSLLNLGHVRDGTVLFMLVRDGISKPFTSTNPPIAWMQATFPGIGCKTLREVCVPASHDSGMSEITSGGLGIKHNTETKPVDVYQQLINGARFFDIRPIYRDKNGTPGSSPH
jgi:hypothetical protein